MTNIAPQEPRPLLPTLPVVPTVPDTPKRIWAKAWSNLLTAIGGLALFLQQPGMLPQLQQAFPGVKWLSLLIFVGPLWNALRNVKETSKVEPTNFSPPQ